MPLVLYLPCFTQLSLAVNLFSGEGLVGNAVRNAVTSIASPMQPAPEVRSSCFFEGVPPSKLAIYPDVPAQVDKPTKDGQLTIPIKSRLKAKWDDHRRLFRGT